MGDRGNIIIKSNGEQVALYTHWGGYQMKQTLAKALERGQGRQWKDATYLARIIFCEMIGGDADGTTGFGIGATPQDNQHPLLIVDVDNQTVYEEPDNREGFEIKMRDDSIAEPVAFSEFARHLQPA